MPLLRLSRHREGHTDLPLQQPSNNHHHEEEEDEKKKTQPRPRVSVLPMVQLACFGLTLLWIMTPLREPSQARRDLPRVVGLWGLDFEPRARRQILVEHTVESLEASQQIREHGSSDGIIGRPNEMETETCRPQYEWQTQQYPTCNLVHESDLSRQYLPGTDVPCVWLIAKGSWRDVWVVGEEVPGNSIIFKTQRMRHLMTPRNLERHRRDAMALEHLTSSPWVLDVYSFCGASGAFELASGGDISRAVYATPAKKNNMTGLEKLYIATQAAMGLAAVHNCDKEGVASIAHADIWTAQYVKIESTGLFKINDFNRARFLQWSKTADEPCPFLIRKNAGRTRSPEEILLQPETEMVDVFSLGHIFYTLLHTEEPFGEIKDSNKVQQLVVQGLRPNVTDEIANSQDPAVQAILTAMNMCHAYDAKKRATARQVEQLLKQKLEEIEPGKLREWEQLQTGELQLKRATGNTRR